MPCVNVQRRIAFVAQIIDVSTGQAQGIDQIANRAFVHPCHAVQPVFAAQNGQGGGERAERCAGVAQKQIGFGVREAAVLSDHVQAACALFQRHAQLRQCFEHPVGVVRFEQGVDVAFVVGQGSQQQRAVADAFGAGQGNGVMRFQGARLQADGVGHGVLGGWVGGAGCF